LKTKSAIPKAMIAVRVIMADGIQADKLAFSLLIGCSSQQIAVVVRKGGASVFTEMVLAVCLGPPLWEDFCEQSVNLTSE
jgi:hypothetical protein